MPVDVHVVMWCGNVLYLGLSWLPGLANCSPNTPCQLNNLAFLGFGKVKATRSVRGSFGSIPGINPHGFTMVSYPCAELRLFEDSKVLHLKKQNKMTWRKHANNANETRDQLDKDDFNQVARN